MIRDEFGSRLTALIPRLHRFAWTLTASKADADDITQATLERALMNRSRLTLGVSLEAWVIRVARNVWLDQLRRRKVRAIGVDPVMFDQVHVIDIQSSGEDRIEAKAALRAIHALQPGHREVAVLAIVEGYSYREVAEALQIPIGTVMSRLARARTALAERLSGPDRATTSPQMFGNPS